MAQSEVLGRTHAVLGIVCLVCVCFTACNASCGGHGVVGHKARHLTAMDAQVVCKIGRCIMCSVLNLLMVLLIC